MNLKTCTRTEWDENQRLRREWSHEHGFDPSMPWHVANWKERCGIILFYIVMGIISVLMAGGGLFVLGAVSDGITNKVTETAVCKKRAETPAEYHQC